MNEFRIFHSTKTNASLPPPPRSTMLPDGSKRESMAAARPDSASVRHTWGGNRRLSASPTVGSVRSISTHMPCWLCNWRDGR